MGDMDTPARDWLDRDLVVAFQAGERWAYDEMYRRYGGRVQGTCRRMLGNVEDAHEATQETFLKAYQALPRFNGNYQLGPWLSRIATNVCFDQLRSRARSAYLLPLPNMHEAKDADPGPDELIAADGRALSTLEDIQPIHARALTLRAIEGMSHKEMADRLAMTPTQVKALLHRARASFKRAWENASGWVAAPLFGFRSLLYRSDEGGPAGAHAVVVTSETAPLLAHKVAASAIVVAAAISGVATAPSAAPAQRAPFALAGTGASITEADVPAATRADAAGRDVVAATGERATTLLDELARAVKGETKKKSKQPRAEDEDDGGGLDPSNPQRASKKIVKEAKDFVEDLPVP